MNGEEEKRIELIIESKKQNCTESAFEPLNFEGEKSLKQVF